jgi:hypothetical protein
MTVTVSSIIGSARGTLIDASAVTFSDTVLVGYLNEGISATCFVKPEAYPVESSLALATGIRQTLPAGSTGLLDVVANGSGTMVTQVDKALLEAADPNWPSGNAVAAIDHYCVDPRLPLQWLCYPPAANGATAVVRYGAVPASVTISDNLPLPDAYRPCLISYVLARAYAMNSKKQDTTKEAYHMQQWGSALGLKTQSQVTNTPRIAAGTPT